MTQGERVLALHFVRVGCKCLTFESTGMYSRRTEDQALTPDSGKYAVALPHDAMPVHRV